MSFLYVCVIVCPFIPVINGIPLPFISKDSSISKSVSCNFVKIAFKSSVAHCKYVICSNLALHSSSKEFVGMSSGIFEISIVSCFIPVILLHNNSIKFSIIVLLYSDNSGFDDPDFDDLDFGDSGFDDLGFDDLNFTDSGFFNIVITSAISIFCFDSSCIDISSI